MIISAVINGLDGTLLIPFSLGGGGGGGGELYEFVITQVC